MVYGMPDSSPEPALFSDGDVEYIRLRSMEAAYDDESIAVFGTIGVSAGWRCLDVGAGAGSVAIAMKERAGSVWALDINAEHLRKLESVEFRVIEADLTAALAQSDIIPDGLDLVHSRLLFGLFRDPVNEILGLCSRLKPGGWIYIEEFDDITFSAASGSRRSIDLHRKVVDAKNAAWARKGLDSYVGRQVLQWIHFAGIERAEAFGSCKVRLSGTDQIRPWALSLPGMRDALIREGLTSDEFEEYREQLERPGFSYLSPTMIRTFGQSRR